MPKRKATELDAEPPVLRRSTRRKGDTQTTAKDADEQSKTSNNNDNNSSSKTKGKKPTSQTAKKASSKPESKGSKTSLDEAKSKKTSPPKSEGKAAVPPAPSQTKENKRHKPVYPIQFVGPPKSAKKSTKTSNDDDGNSTKKTQTQFSRALVLAPKSRARVALREWRRRALFHRRLGFEDRARALGRRIYSGIRAYAARNNLRAMKKGELAFFYHSNCKEPGIVGTMEIVQEHSPDESAHDPKAPYYDPSSKPEDPKWSVVHVKFRSKFAKPVGLKELREMGKPGHPLEYMQMLKQSRLSVSRVSPPEWDYLMDLVQKQGGEEMSEASS
ncbi:hypothetical protein NPX13_g10282 [Xylaria arbuscula]|uniref:EVE domain-containing protein n=1 Tax=Xylaria arbuscula TaxID=114810 RepID=A0A9W8N520_9PEZI|nr:hypothetical protein NPX13_g10282 [Xylaria arbuscula]